MELLSGGFSGDKIYSIPKCVLRLFKDDIKLLEQKYRDMYIDKAKKVADSMKILPSGIAPSIFYNWDGGRIESFIDGKTPSLQETKNNLINIARTLSTLHKINIDEHHWLERDDFINILMTLFDEQKLPLNNDIGSSNELLNKCSNELLNKNTISFIKYILSGTKPLMSICHNDLFRGNMIMNKHSHITFIDFEMISISNPLYDIANFFNEMAIDFDLSFHPEFYPSITEQLHFFHEWKKSFDIITENEFLFSIRIFSCISHLYSAFGNEPELFEYREWRAKEYIKQKNDILKELNECKNNKPCVQHNGICQKINN